VDDEPEIVTNPLTFNEDVVVDNNEEVKDDMGWDVDDESALDEEQQEDEEDINPSKDEEEDHFLEKMQLMIPSSLNRADIF
jgi:Skp family chaperone for outer membrane proteins